MRMSPEPRAAEARRRRPGAFRRAEDGATAIEFALLGPPFLILLFMIMEVGLVFFGAFALDGAVDKSARLIRTGQMQAGGFDEAGFRNAICENLAGPIDCGENLKFDVKSFPSFSAVVLDPPVNDQGEVEEEFGYSPGGSSQVVVVRVFYEWELIGKLPNFGIPNFGLSNLANGNRLLQSTAVFRNEPF
jgi:Flp pilus assembly protein TadG